MKPHRTAMVLEASQRENGPRGLRSGCWNTVRLSRWIHMRSRQRFKMQRSSTDRVRSG